MTTRTRPKHSRPNSAVYLGTDPLVLGSTPPGIPDLPEPPSPVSSNGSGLPSPPATNSTGSGSTGDPASIALRSTKRSTTSMLSAANVKTFHAAFSPEHLDDNDEDDNDHDLGNENDEDDTARLNRRHSLKTNENTLAIQRALNLKERTKMTIDKLSSYSRNTPSPSTNPRHSLPSFTSDSSSSSSSRRHRPEPHHSGSETEREQPESNSRPSTPRRNRTRLISAPASPGKALLGLTSTQSSSSNSSNSPSKPRKRASMAMSEFAELTGRRIRSPDTYETPQHTRRSTDITQAAMAAVAMSRGKVSPTNSKRRQPLPKEFMDASTSASGSASGSRSTTSVSRRGSLSSSRHLDDGDDDRNHVSSVEPSTPHHSTMPRPSSISGSKYLQLSPRQQRNLDSTLTDPRPTTGRSATIRRHQTGGRWVSEDISSVTSSSRVGDEEYDNPPSAKGRMQTMRASGSADSALTIGAGGAGRSLLGEGLKAAGLSNGSVTVGRSRGADVFDDTPLRDKDRLTRDRERAVRIERIERSLSRNRGRSRVGWDEEEEEEEDAFERRRPGSRNRGSDIRTRAGTVVGPRAATSMAEYRVPDREPEGVGGNEAIVREDGADGPDEPRTAPPQLRSYKSTYDLPTRRELSTTRGDFERDKELERERDRGRDRERERTQSSLSRYASVSSPFGSRRFDSNTISSQNQQPSRVNGSGKQASDRSDHTRLLHDSLRMFESHVSRMPSTTSATAGDLLRNAQNIVSSAEKLNALLRAGTSKVLDAQIEAEVEASTGTGDSAADVWRWVGSEFREGMRYSDDLVRSVTDFLLGVGRAVKDMSGGDGHGRSVSLDEEGLSLGGRLARSSLSPDVTGGSSGSGRRSTESRRSWGEDLKRLSTGTRTATGSRPPSALNLLESRETHETPPAASVRSRQQQPNGIVSNGVTSSTRRLLSPREIRDQQLGKDLNTFDSQETLHGYEPSPTPAPRTQQARNQASTTLDRSRTLPPLSIPQPLPTLPSESQSRRQNDKTPSSSSARRRPTVSGAPTLRGSVFPSISPNVPTTALTTHTVSNSPERAAFPILRTDSSGSAESGSGGKSAGATPRSTVTFSRSSTVSALTGLQQAQQKQRQRTISSTSSHDDVERPAATVGIVRTASGSETERDIRRGTVADRSRMSMDGAHPADRSAASSILAGRPKERRKSIVDVWSRGGGR